MKLKESLLFFHLQTRNPFNRRMEGDEERDVYASVSPSLALFLSFTSSQAKETTSRLIF